jgi:hypothetical protein
MPISDLQHSNDPVIEALQLKILAAYARLTDWHLAPAEQARQAREILDGPARQLHRRRDAYRG